MKELIGQFINNGISRRDLMRGLGAAGLTGREKRANIEGRPYLLDILVDRAGVGSASERYPPYSIAAKRSRKA